MTFISFYLAESEGALSRSMRSVFTFSQLFLVLEIAVSRLLAARVLVLDLSFSPAHARHFIFLRPGSQRRNFRRRQDRRPDEDNQFVADFFFSGAAESITQERNVLEERHARGALGF